MLGNDYTSFMVYISLFPFLFFDELVEINNFFIEITAFCDVLLGLSGLIKFLNQNVRTC